MARPAKEISPDSVRKMAQVGCTDAEIAFVFGCSESLLRGRFAEALHRGRGRLKIALRHQQIKTARKGNVAMQIWLGKQYLGQTDKQEISEHGGTLRIVERIEPAGGAPGEEPGGPGSDHGSPDAPAT